MTVIFRLKTAVEINEVVMIDQELMRTGVWVSENWISAFFLTAFCSRWNISFSKMLNHEGRENRLATGPQTQLPLPIRVTVDEPAVRVFFRLSATLYQQVDQTNVTWGSLGGSCKLWLVGCLVWFLAQRQSLPTSTQKTCDHGRFCDLLESVPSLKTMFIIWPVFAKLRGICWTAAD